MKKFISILLVLVMAMGMASMVFALPASNPGDDDGPTNSSSTVVTAPAKDESGDDVTVAYTELATNSDAYRDVNNEASAVAFVEHNDLVADVNAAMAGTNSNARHITTVNMYDVRTIRKNGTAVTTTGAVTATLPANGIKAGDAVVVLQKGADGWKALEATAAEDGKVTVTLTEMAPIALMKGAACELNN